MKVGKEFYISNPYDPDSALKPLREPYTFHFREKPENGSEQDMVNHPAHYTGHPKGIECIDVIEENPHPNLANAMKYLWRVSWGGKDNDTQDLEKAVWYIQRELKRRDTHDDSKHTVQKK